jgi:acyl-CoA thioester hydrolase
MADGDTAPGAAPDLRSRATFKHWSRVQIRYNDQDPLGHINNAAYAFYLEHARCELINPMITGDGIGRMDTVIARLVIDFLRELTYPGVAEVGTLVTQLGTTSFHMAHGIFKEGSDTCSATGETVMVWFDLDRRTKVAHPPAIKLALARYAR